ncbi:MAG: right-handed parallel beta-helix repeat-containing protein [Candidatus Binatia bacterium]
MPFRTLIGLVALLLASAARAATYYVATTGNDANAGSQAAPWRTLQKAGDVAAAGDDVVVLPGAYAGSRPRHSGTVQAPVRFLAQAGVVVNAPGAANSNGDNIWVRDVDYVVIDGFESTAAPRAGIAVQGEPDANAAGVVVRRCVCHHNSRWGIFTGFARDLVLEDNETSYSAIEHGIYVSNSGDRPTVRRNHAHHNNASGIQLNADPSQMGPDPNDPQGDGVITGALVEANLIHDNGSAGGAAINLASVRSSVIRNNLLYANLASGIAGWDDGDGSAVGTRDNRLLGNTIVQPSGSRFAISLLNGSTGNLIADNILLHLGTRGSVSADPSSQVGLVSDYNAVVDRFSDDAAFLTLAQWRGLGFDAHSLVATAASLFVNAEGNDYHLSATSPARDAGLAHVDLPVDRDGVTRPQGAGVDLGAYERAAATSPTPTPTGTPPPPPTATRTGLRPAGAVLTRSGRAAAQRDVDAERRRDAHGRERRRRRLRLRRRGARRLAADGAQSGDQRGAVTSLDAAWILQHVAALRALDGGQRLAADVTGDGTVSPLDATLILQRAVGLPAAFNAATACGSDWLFAPNASVVANQSVVPPALANGSCVAGSLTYAPLAADASGQSFTAILLGDVTANWH